MHSCSSVDNKGRLTSLYNIHVAGTNSSYFVYKDWMEDNISLTERVLLEVVAVVRVRYAIRLIHMENEPMRFCKGDNFQTCLSFLVSLCLPLCSLRSKLFPFKLNFFFEVAPCTK